jgi:hypothetical protein
MKLTLQQLPDDHDSEVYPTALKELLIERLEELSSGPAEQCRALGQDYSYRMRYIGNELKLWFVPTAFAAQGWKPLIESPVPKDKWVSNEAFALIYPPISDDLVRGTLDFLFGGRLQERYDDPEVQGGKIALVETNNQLVQKPPNCLGPMTTTNLKQVAYNQRVLKAEDEIAGINCDVADFLSEMNDAEQVIICVNAGASMKRHEEVIAGQFWQQGERQMTAVNRVIDGMANTRESAILSAAVDAVEWNHATEPEEGTRQQQRIIIGLNPHPDYLPLQLAGPRLRPAVRVTPLNPHLPLRKREESQEGGHPT